MPHIIAIHNAVITPKTKIHEWIFNNSFFILLNLMVSINLN